MGKRKTARAQIKAARDEHNCTKGSGDDGTVDGGHDQGNSAARWRVSGEPLRAGPKHQHQGRAQKPNMLFVICEALRLEVLRPPAGRALYQYGSRVSGLGFSAKELAEGASPGIKSVTAGKAYFNWLKDMAGKQKERHVKADGTIATPTRSDITQHVGRRARRAPQAQDQPARVPRTAGRGEDHEAEEVLTRAQRMQAESATCQKRRRAQANGTCQLHMDLRDARGRGQ
jgi:hypothetical protein